jgi:hypothetical protein
MSGDSGEKRDVRPSNTDMAPQTDVGPDAGPRLDPELLGALLDGRLSGKARDTALAQLALSPDDIELAADVVAVDDELRERRDDPDRSSGAARSRRFMRRVQWAAIAALLVCAVALPLLLRRPDNAGDAGAAVALLGDTTLALPSDWEELGRAALRGGTVMPTAESRSIELGTLLTDLDVAATRDTNVARRVAGRIQALLAESPAASSAAAAYADIASGRNGLSRDERARARGSIAALAPIVDLNALRAGAWLRAAWIAAIARDSAYFADPRSAAAASVDQLLRSRNGGAASLDAMLELARERKWVDLADAIAEQTARLEGR